MILQPYPSKFFHTYFLLICYGSKRGEQTKWTAFEALENRQYTTKSDVYVVNRFTNFSKLDSGYKCNIVCMR